MPTSGDLKSGDFSFTTPRYRTNTPPSPKENGDEASCPSNRPPCPQIDLQLVMLTLTLQRGKKEEDFRSQSSEDFLS